MSDLAAIQATVHGLVQGVSFRASTFQRAAGLKVTGFVRNASGGSVEVYAEGEKAELEKLITFLRQGPPRARVEKVDIKWQPATGGYSEFSIRY